MEGRNVKNVKLVNKKYFNYGFLINELLLPLLYVNCADIIDLRPRELDSFLGEIFGSFFLANKLLIPFLGVTLELFLSVVLPYSHDTFLAVKFLILFLVTFSVIFFAFVTFFFFFYFLPLLSIVELKKL